LDGSHARLAKITSISYPGDLNKREICLNIIPLGGEMMKETQMTLSRYFNHYMLCEMKKCSQKKP
jgi:hypothetical protein